MSFASSSTDMKNISPISPTEEYINSFKNTREVGIQIKVHSKDVGTQTYKYEEDESPMTMIEPYKIDEDYMTKMDRKPYGVDYGDDDDKVDQIFTDIDLYIASILMQFNKQKK